MTRVETLIEEALAERLPHRSRIWIEFLALALGAAGVSRERVLSVQRAAAWSLSPSSR